MQKRAKSSSSERPVRAAKVSGKDVLERMAGIHGSLAVSAARIEAIVSELLRSTDKHGHISVFDLQELDKVRQSLENLQSISQAVAKHMPSGVAIPKQALTKVLTLGGMESTLLGEEGDAAAPDIHLFD